jgi:hypothetical protein
MSILHPPMVSSAQLSFYNGSYVGEISDTDGFGRVYDDACDEGLTLVSQRTGREVVFVVDRTEVRDGEVVSWRLIPADPRLRREADMILFND